MTYYNCVLISEDEIKQKYPNLLKDGYTSTDIKTEITAWQDKQRKTLGESYKYDSIPLEKEIYNRIEEKELAYYNSPAYEKELQDILDKAPRDKEGHLLAPNGKPTNLTERQYAQVRTKSFKRWFGDWINNPETASKVVDENGEPLVVYHTTDDKTMVAGKANFTIFSKKENNGKMFYFTDNRPMSESYIQKNRTFKSLNDVNKRIILLKERLEKAEKYIDDLEHPENYINRVRKLKNMTFDEYIAYLGFDNLEDFKKQNANENLKKEAYRDKQNILNEINRLKNFTETDLIATRSFFLNIKSPEIFEGNNTNWNELAIFGETSDSIEQKKKYMKDKSAYKAEMLEKYASLSNPKSYENYTLYGIGLYGEDLEDMLSDFYFKKWITDVSEKFPLDYSKDLAAISTRGIEQYINSNTSSSVDGFIVKNIYDYGIGAIFTPKEKLTSGTVIATKNPNQIKSATDNIGAFSTEDTNIYKHLLHKDIISEKDYIDFLTEFELNRDKTDDFLYNFITKILQVNPRNKRDKSIPLTVQNYPTSNKVFINYKSERAIINRILGLSADFSFDSETFEKDLKDYIENKWEKELYEELIRLDKELLSNLNHLYKERAKVQNNISLLQVYLNHREQSPKEVLEYVESFKSTKRKTTSLSQHIGYELKKKKSELAILDEKIKHYRFSNASRTLKVKNRLAALYNIDNVKELVFNRIKADRDSYKLPKEEWEKKIAPYMSLYEKAKKASKNAELLEYNNPIFENKKSLDEISVNELYNKLIQLNPKMKSFLEFIKLVNPKLKIKVYNTEDYNNLAEREDSYISGQSASIFFPRKNEVAFRLNADTSTILHELLHSVSSYGLIGSSKEQKALGKNVIQPFIDYIDNYLKQNVGNFGSYSIFGAKMPATIYGLTNPAEFIAELFSNKDFQELLDAIPPMEKKQYSSLLEEIIDSILNFVKNIFAPKTNETALDQAIQLSLAVIRTQYENIDEIYEQLSNIEDTAQKQILDKQASIQSINYYSGNIIPDANTIFVFGSNPEGRHGAGAAKIAREQFGAIYGQGEGLQGNAYALPTKDLRIKKNNGLKSISPEQIIENIKKLYETARQNPDKQFKVAYRNTDKASLNGYTGLEMIDMFLKAGSIPSNIYFSKEWIDTGKFNLSTYTLNSNQENSQFNQLGTLNDNELFNTSQESEGIISSEKTILSNEELKYWNEKGLGKMPRILVGSERTDPAFHVKTILDILEGKTTVSEWGVVNGKRTIINQLSGKDFAGLYLITKHDGLPMLDLLKTKIPKLIHFSITSLGGTKWEPGVMKYNDLLNRIQDYIKQGLDPESVTIRIDPIVPGVTEKEDIENIVKRASSMGIKRIRFSIMDAYPNTKKAMSELGYDFNTYYGNNFFAKKDYIDDVCNFMLSLKDKYNITLGTCAENIVRKGISKEGCLSVGAVNNMLGTSIEDKGIDNNNQRKLCTCYGGKIDALQYNKNCASHCVYCYAKHENDKALTYYNEDGTLKDNVYTRTRYQSSISDNQTSHNNSIKKEDITEESQQIPVYQTPTLEEDTRASVAFPNSIVRRDRVNLIKRLIYKGLSNEYSRQLEELDKRLAEVNQTKDKEERSKETLEILKAKADLTEEKAIEAGIGRVIKEVKEAFNIDNPNNSKQAERYLLRNNKKFNALSKEEQDKVIEQRVNKKHQNYRVILDNWNSLLDEALVLIHNEYGIKIDKSSEPEVEEEVGRDMYQFKARLEDMRSSLSKEVQKLISNVKHIKSDGKILKDDLGFAKYLNSDYVHMSLLNYLSKARNCQDFWRIFEKLAIKKPWVAELQKELEKNESLKSKFYQDFRKEFVPYWIEYDYETNSKTGQRVRKTKRINTIAPMYNTLEMWKDNIEGGITLNNVNIFNEDGSINKDNVEKVIETLETIFKEFRNAHNKSNLEGRDIVLEFIKNNEPKIQVIIESLGLEVDLDSLHETLIEKDSNIESILSNITSILKGINDGKLEGTNMKGEPIQLDFFDTFGGYAKNLTKVLNIVDKNGILKSFREQGNTYQSYSVPSYFGKLIENLKNGTPEEIREYIMNKFGKDRWFYNPKTETWNNSWLQSIYDNPTKFKEIIDRKVVLTSNKKSFNDWDDKQYALSMLSEFGIGESKNTAYYYLPVLADAESAEFIQFERIAGSDDTFKRTIREKLAKVVLQEYDRIQLVKQRKIDGAVSIDNFDRNGLKFNFIPELNTYEINGKLFIDALTESITKKNLESRDTIIDTALSTILEEGLTGFKTALNKSGVLVNTKDNRNVYYGLTNEGMNNELTNFYYNNALAQTQIIQLLTTDLAYYKNLNDFQKRFKEVYVMNRKLNTTSKYGRKFEKTLILVDEKRQAPSYDTIKEILDTGVKNKRITEEDRNRILSLYKKINVTDAQAFRSLSSYRAVLDMAGRWTPQLEEAFERMEQAYKARLKGDKVTTFSVDDFYIILQTIKPFMYTVTTKSTGVKNTDDFGQYLLSPMQNKNSEFLLVNLMNTMVSALSNSGKLKAIERFMEDYQVDVVQFESAVKCGAQGKVDLSQFSDTDENGVYNYLKEISGLEEDRIYGNPDYITVIDYEDYGIQTENPEHLRDTKALFGTQLRKLIFEDIPTGTTFKIDGESYTKEELWSLYNQLITVNVFNSYNDVAEEFSTIDGIAKLVSRQVKENPQMYSEELRKACELVDVKDEKTGEVHKEFNIPIHEPTQRNRIESLLLSVIKNSVIKQKIKGASCVQVSCFGVSNDLKIVRTKEGGIKHIECYLPAYSKLFFEPFMKENENGETYLDVNELPEDLRKCVGYRIPTEGLYSMQPLYIKGFLPIQNGSMIMLPAEITALTGSDFDIDKVFLMLPEFDSGTFIKKASLKWNFKKYLKNSLKKYTSKENSYDEDFDNAYDKLEQIVKKDESKDILSTNLEKALYKFYEENKEKYTYPVRKVKYNFNKTLEENIQGKSVQRTTQIVNNALIDIIYGILTSPESAHKILDGGNFELAKCGDRICKIANNVTNLNKLAKLLHLEDNSSNSILAKLESMSSEQLDEILKDVETPLSPLSPVTNLYFHGQNANGGKMIGIYANSSVANAMFQMANVLLKTDNKKGIYPIVFNNEIFDVLGDMYDMNGRLISRNIKNFLAASVDNVKDPVLKGLMQSPTTGNLTCMLILAGVDINSVGLFLNQPLTKELITKLDADSNLNINDAIDVLLKAHGLEGKEISANSKQRYDQLLKEDLFKNIIQHNDEADLIFLTKFKEYYDKAKSYRKIVSVLRNDTKNNSIESSVAGCLKLLNNLNEFFNSSNKHFSVGNLISFVNKNREELQEVLNVVSESSVPFMSTFASFGIGSVMELMGPYTPFLNESLWNIITDDEFGLSKLYVKDSIPDSFYESILNDYYLFILNQNDFYEHFDSNGKKMNEDESREYFIRKFPNEFRKLKNEIPELKNNQFIKKIIPVLPSKNDKFGKKKRDSFPFTVLKFQNSGSLSRIQEEQYSKDWFSLLTSDNPDIVKLGIDLFKYSTYFGFGFKPFSYMRMASVNIRKSIPKYLELINNQNNFDISSERNSIFIHSYLRNHAYDDNIVPTIIGSNLKSDKEGSIVLSRSNPSHRSIVETKLKTGFTVDENKQYYDILRPMVKIKSEEGTFLYQISSPIIRQNENVVLYPVTPLGYKGKIFEYNFNSYPKSVINKTSEVENIEIEDSLSDTTVNIDDGRLDFKDISEYYDDFIGDSLEDFDSYETLDDEGNKVCDLSI